MEATIHENTYQAKSIFPRNTFLPKAFAKPREQKMVQNDRGHSIAYFLWVFVAIFSTIMVAVMIEEKFFI